MDLLVKYGSAPYKAVVDWGDRKEDTITSFKDDFILQHAYGSSGRYIGKLTVTDALDQSQDVYFAVHVKESARSLLLNPLLLLPLGIAALAAYFVIYKRRASRYKS